MIRSAVLIQSTRVTDGQTDGWTDGIGMAYTRYSISIYAVARKNCHERANDSVCYIQFRLRLTTECIDDTW